MAKELKEHGISVDYKVDENSPADDHIVVKLFKRVKDGDNESVGERTYKPAELPESIRRRGLLYGFSKLVQDRTSDESGSADRLSSMDEVWDRFKSDAWEKERESTGRQVRIEVEALARIKGVTVRDIQASLRNYDAEAREKILTSAAVTAEVDKMKAEAEAKGDEAPSLDDLL